LTRHYLFSFGLFNNKLYSYRDNILALNYSGIPLYSKQIIHTRMIYLRVPVLIRVLL